MQSKTIPGNVTYLLKKKLFQKKYLIRLIY